MSSKANSKILCHEKIENVHMNQVFNLWQHHTGSSIVILNDKPIFVCYLLPKQSTPQSHCKRLPFASDLIGFKTAWCILNCETVTNTLCCIFRPFLVENGNSKCSIPPTSDVADIVVARKRSQFFKMGSIAIHSMASSTCSSNSKVFLEQEEKQCLCQTIHGHSFIFHQFINGSCLMFSHVPNFHEHLENALDNNKTTPTWTNKVQWTKTVMR